MMLCAATINPTGAATCACEADAADAGDRAAAQLVETVYGADLRRVAGTSDRGDDVELAKRMLASAAEIEGNPAAAALMCEHAHRLTASVPSARQTAIEAVTAMLKLAPQRRAESLDALIALYEDEARAQRGEARQAVGRLLLTALEDAAALAEVDGRYDDGDRYYRRALGIAGFADPDRKPWLLDKARGMKDMLNLVAEAERLMDGLKQKPDDRDAGRRLVRVLIELDRAADARKYSFLADESTAKLIVLAATAPGELDANQTLAVADWYTHLAGEASAAPAVTRLKRRALERYERLAGAGDESMRGRVALAASKLRQDLGAAAPPPIAAAAPGAPDAPAAPAADKPGAVIDIIALLKGNDDGGHIWRKKDGVMASVGDAPRGALPTYFSSVDQSLDKGYTVISEVRWRDRTEAVGLMLCATGRSPLVFLNDKVAVLLGVGGQPVNFEIAQPYAAGQWHRFQANVQEKDRRTQIEMLVDGKAVLRWEGETRDLSAPPHPDDPGTIGIGMVARRDGTEFRVLSVKVHSGVLKALPERR